MSEQPIEVHADEAVINTDTDGGGIDHNETVEPSTEESTPADSPSDDNGSDQASSEA